MGPNDENSFPNAEKSGVPQQMDRGSDEDFAEAPEPESDADEDYEAHDSAAVDLRELGIPPVATQINRQELGKPPVTTEINGQGLGIQPVTAGINGRGLGIPPVTAEINRGELGIYRIRGAENQQAAQSRQQIKQGRPNQKLIL